MRNEQGFTLVELTISLTVLAVGVLGTAATFGSLVKIGDERTQETSRSVVLRNAIATLQSVAFEDAPTVYDPQSSVFACLPDGTVVLQDVPEAIGKGVFQFYTDEGAIPAGFADLPQGFDLNGNGLIDAGPVTDYRLLPVRITLSLEERGVVRTTNTDLLFRAW